MAIAAAWAATMITVALEMALPAVVGLFVDRWLGTVALFTVLGSLFGLGAGMWHLLQIVQSRAGKSLRS